MDVRFEGGVGAFGSLGRSRRGAVAVVGAFEEDLDSKGRVDVMSLRFVRPLPLALVSNGATWRKSFMLRVDDAGGGRVLAGGGGNGIEDGIGSLGGCDVVVLGGGLVAHSALLGSTYTVLACVGVVGDCEDTVGGTGCAD